jgi:hypothetical protein
MDRATIGENHSLEKDFKSKAVLSKDNEAYKAALLRRRNRIEGINEINNLKNEVKELKGLVQKLLENR